MHAFCIGAGPEVEITGHRLRTYPNLYKLLEPEAGERIKRYGQTAEEEKMSAKQYRELHKEDFREPHVSARQQQDWEKAIYFFLETRPEYIQSENNGTMMRRFIVENGLRVSPQALEAAFQALKSKGELELNERAIQDGQVVTVANLTDVRSNSDVRSGFVANDSNIAAKVAKMSAAEYAEWLRTPSNRKAMDDYTAGRR